MNMRIMPVKGGLYVTDINNHLATDAETNGPGGPAIPQQGPWLAILAHEASVITATAANLNGGTQMASVKMPAGFTWFGHFTQFQLSSGSVTAYKLVHN